MKIYGIIGNITAEDGYHEQRALISEIHRFRKGLPNETPYMLGYKMCPFFSSSAKAKDYIKYLEKNRDSIPTKEFQDTWKTNFEELEVIELDVES